MLKLGKRFGIVEMFQNAMERITGDYPDTVEQWQVRCGPSYKCKVEPYRGLEVDLINLAEELGIERVIPAAFSIILKEYKLVSNRSHGGVTCCINLRFCSLRSSKAFCARTENSPYSLKPTA